MTLGRPKLNTPVPKPKETAENPADTAKGQAWGIIDTSTVIKKLKGRQVPDVTDSDHITVAFSAGEKTLVIALIIIVACFGAFALYKNAHRTSFQDDSVIKADRDSIARQDVQIREQVVLLQRRIESDSIRLANIEAQLDNLPNTLKQLNLTYNEKRANYAAMPFDKRFVLFAGFLSTIDTVTK